jgi:hypothetical protein
VLQKKKKKKKKKKKQQQQQLMAIRYIFPSQLMPDKASACLATLLAREPSCQQYGPKSRPMGPGGIRLQGQPVKNFFF